VRGFVGIDRERRRRAAEALAAFMRGEITSAEYQSAFDGDDWEAAREDDRLLLYARSMWWRPHAEEHTVSVSEDVWGRMRRVLALLASDLEEREEVSGLELTFGWRLTLVAGVVLAGLVALAVWQLGALGLVALPLVALVLLLVLKPLTGKRITPSGRRGGMKMSEWSRKVAPFETEAQWLAHEHLLERFGLPAYDAAIHHRPVEEVERRTRWGERLLALLSAVGALLLFVVVVGFVMVVTAPLLPLIFLFMPRRTRRMVVGGNEEWIQNIE
jgi:hypothetical protein